MDSVRALLILLPDAQLPEASSVEHADAIVLAPPTDEADFATAADRVADALQLGPPIYLVIPPLESGLARRYLQSAFQAGVYGIASQALKSVDQLRYLESLLEELEVRAGVRAGLTAMAVGFDSPRALTIMAEALSAMRHSADRMTWIAFNHVDLAAILGVEPESATVASASASVVLTAAGFELPVVYGSPGDAELAASLGFRGCATVDAADLEGLRSIFSRSETESVAAEESA